MRYNKMHITIISQELDTICIKYRNLNIFILFPIFHETLRTQLYLQRKDKFSFSVFCAYVKIEQSNLIACSRKK